MHVTYFCKLLTQVLLTPLSVLLNFLLITCADVGRYGFPYGQE